VKGKGLIRYQSIKKEIFLEFSPNWAQFFLKRHFEERERKEQRRREEITSGKRSPLHLSHR